MARFATVTHSHMVGVSVPLKKALENARGLWMSRALSVSAFVARFFGAIGVGAAYFIQRQKNAVDANNQKAVLKDYFRNQVAAQLDIDPKNVTESDFRFAARVNPMIGQAVAKVDAERKNENRNATLAAGGAVALGGAVAGLGWLPGGSGIAHMAAKAGVDLVGSTAGGVIGSMLSKDVLHTLDVVGYIDEKLVAGETVTAHDIVLLRISQDEVWQKEFAKKNGKAFHKLGEADQQDVIAGMPDMLLGAEKQAEALNKRLISPQNLVMAGPASSSTFSNTIGSKRTASSHVAAVNAQRAQPVGPRTISA